jgi:hypothetical protein
MNISSKLIYTTACALALFANTVWAIGANVGTSVSTNTGNVGTRASSDMAGTRAEATTNLPSVSLSNSSSSNWNSQDSYWRNNYNSRPYYSMNRDYSAYEPAYRYGVELYDRNPGRRYDDLDQTELRRGWNEMRGNSNMSWDDAREASRDAYNRMDHDRAPNLISDINNRASLSTAR